MANNKPKTYTGGDIFQALAWGVLLQAARDVREANGRAPDARSWLLTDAPIWLDGLGADIGPDIWQAWVEHGCPDVRKPRKPRKQPELSKSATFPGQRTRKAITEPQAPPPARFRADIGRLWLRMAHYGNFWQL